MGKFREAKDAYLARVRDPIIADRSLDLMAAAWWFMIGAWGLTSAITGLPTIGNAVGPMIETAWAFFTGVTCMFAFSGAMSTFFITPNIQDRIKRKRFEMNSAAVAGGFILAYPLLVFQAVVEGDLSRLSTFFLASAAMIIPTWRVRHLYHRIRRLKDVLDAHTGEVPL